MNNSSDIIKHAYINNDILLLMDNIEFESNYLSKKVKKLSSVKKMCIIDSDLEQIEYYPPNLEELSIINCVLNNIDTDTIPESLTNLILNNNLLEFFVFSTNLENLVELDLSYNKISDIPYINHFLKKLNLEGNDIEKINNVFEKCTLEELNLGMNSIEVIENLPISLTNLNISKNTIKYVDISKLINLKKIIANCNDIILIQNKLPESLSHIDFSYNNLKSLPDLLSLNSITYINVKSNSELKLDKNNLKLIESIKNNNSKSDSNSKSNYDSTSSTFTIDSDDDNIDIDINDIDDVDDYNYRDKSSENSENSENNDNSENSENSEKNKNNNIILNKPSKIYINLKRMYEV